MLVGTWSWNQYRFYFPVPPFAKGFSCQHPLGDPKSYLFFSHNILKLTLSCVTWASAKSMQYILGKESSRDFQTRELRFVVACLTTASGRFPSTLCTWSLLVGSLRFAQCNSAGLPCYKILCSGFLNVPLPIGMGLKDSPKGRHIFDQLLSSTA